MTEVATGVTRQDAKTPDAPQPKLEILLDIVPEAIDLNPYNPRRNFDEAELKALGNSLKHGQVQPIVVREVETPLHGFKRYQLIVGERRLKAAQLVNMKTIKARVVQLSERESLTWLLTENLHRHDLDPIEQATGYQTMMKELGATQAEVAKQVGIKQPAVAKAVGLLALPEPVQDLIRGNALTASHGTALLKFRDNPDMVLRVAMLAVKENWSQRDIEKYKLEDAAKLVTGQEPTERPSVTAAQTAEDARAANIAADSAQTPPPPSEPAHVADAATTPTVQTPSGAEPDEPHGSASAADEIAKNKIINECNAHLWELVTTKDEDVADALRERMHTYVATRSLMFYRDVSILEAARGLGYDADEMTALKSKSFDTIFAVTKLNPMRALILLEVVNVLEAIHRDPESDVTRWLLGGEEPSAI